MKRALLHSVAAIVMAACSARASLAQDTARPKSQWPYPIADRGKYSFTLFDLLEYQRASTVNALRWDLLRWSGVLGLQGLLPYRFDIEPTLFLSNKGRLSGSFAATYDVLLTQRLIL